MANINQLYLAARILGGLIIAGGFTSLALAPLIGQNLFERLWGAEPLTYIGGVLIIIGLSLVTLSYVFLSWRGGPDANGKAEMEASQRWSQITHRRG